MTGNPYEASHWDEQGTRRPSEETLASVYRLGERVATFAERLAPVTA